MPLDDARNALWELDTDHVGPEIARELLRQAEMRHEAIFRAALGMDQRAAVLAAGFIAAAGALAAAAIALSSGRAALWIPALLSSALLLIAAGLCAWACRPQAFRFPGLEPLDWGSEPSYLQQPLAVLQIARSAQLQDHMTENEHQQRRNGAFLSLGLFVAASAPLVGFLTWSVLAALAALT